MESRLVAAAQKGEIRHARVQKIFRDRLMGSRMGFEYRYGFGVDYDIIPQYSLYLRCWQAADFMFLFEIRTNFSVKTTKLDDDEMIIDSESFATAGWEKICTEKFLKLWMGRRLKDYGMSDDEIQELVGKALAFAKQSERNPQHGVMPVVVNLDICTIQQECEPINATATATIDIDRVMKTQYLYPMSLCPYNEASPRKNHLSHWDHKLVSRWDHKFVSVKLLFFLRDKLPTIIVGDDDKCDMGACPICFDISTIGAQISVLHCGHAFHTYCIVHWLVKSNTCPMCREQVHDLNVCYNKYN